MARNLSLTWHGFLWGLVLALFLVSSARAADWAGEPADETPGEAELASAAAEVLVGAQLSRHPLDNDLSGRFLDGYLDALDSLHLVFFQSDVDEFAWFRPELAQMTAAAGETWPAHLVFARYLQRLESQVSFQTTYLKTASFDFSGSDSWQPERRHLPRPRDLEAAKALWRQEVRADFLEEKLQGVASAKIPARLARRYDRRLRIMQHLKYEEVFQIYLDVFAHAFDPHSDYFGRQEAQEFNTELSLSLAGIGGSLEAKGGYWVIGELVPGGPAARSGRLHPGDRIVSVAQGDTEPEAVTDLPSWQVVGLIRGKEGSTVRLTVAPVGLGNGARTTVSLVRENVKLTDQYAKATVVDLASGQGAAVRLGVIDLPLFYEGSGPEAAGAAADVARLVRRLKTEGITGLVLDLRRNPGGSLSEAIKLTGLFIPGAPVLQTRDAEGHAEVAMSPGTNALYSGPLVVLTSRHSASSAEVVAGTLQDFARAVIVGDSSTFGKGTVQTLVPLKKLIDHPGLGTMKVTVAKFYRPSGGSTQLKGILPDIVLPSESDLPDFGEARLDYALPWDTVAPAAYRKCDLVAPVLSALRAKSAARVAGDPWFQLVRGEVAAWAAQSGQPLTLNESVRRQENEGVDQLQNKLRTASRTVAVRARTSRNLSLVPAVAGVPAADSAPADDRILREAEDILADYAQSFQTLPTEVGVMNFHPCQADRMDQGH
jgi:carboxyl-terminal processing protease